MRAFFIFTRRDIMTKTLCIRSKGGFGNFVKISSTLKRKLILLQRIEYHTIDDQEFYIELTLSGNDRTVHQAFKHMKKNEDVYEIIEK
jgi:hypothetical protein